MKRIILCLILVMAVASVSAMGTMKNPDTLTYLWASDIRSLDPAYVGSTPGSYPSFNCYDRLLNFFEDLHVVDARLLLAPDGCIGRIARLSNEPHRLGRVGHGNERPLLVVGFQEQAALLENLRVRQDPQDLLLFRRAII